MSSRWSMPLAAAVVGFVAVAYGNRWTSSILLILTAVFLVAVLTPWLFPRSTTDESARARAAERGVPLIYWRRGCTFCIRLRLALLLSRTEAVWMSVSADDAASARVRSVNDGNETVPTVFFGSQTRTNPAPSWVAKLSA